MLACSRLQVASYWSKLECHTYWSKLECHTFVFTTFYRASKVRISYGYHSLPLVKVHQFPSPALFLFLTISFLYPPPFFFQLSSCVMEESFLLLCLPLLFLNLSASTMICELRLCETFASFFYSHLSFWNFGRLYLTIRFHLLFSTILLIPFCPLFRTFSFLLHRLFPSIPPAN